MFNIKTYLYEKKNHFTPQTLIYLSEKYTQKMYT